MEENGIIFALLQIHVYSQMKGPSMVIMSYQDLSGGSHLTVRGRVLV